MNLTRSNILNRASIQILITFTVRQNSNLIEYPRSIEDFIYIGGLKIKIQNNDFITALKGKVLELITK